MPTLAEAAYYREKFTRDPLWSSQGPNTDEMARWTAIERMLDGLPALASRRLLDVGCGRGWLTNLASRYGETQGLEPVIEVADFARRMYPALRFHSCTLPELIQTPEFQPFDVVLSSEVIEHVPSAEQRQFVATLRCVVRIGGTLILTAPRREMFERWRSLRKCLPKRLRADPDQPIEEPLTERELQSMLVESGFRIERHARAYVRYRALSPANALLGVRWIERVLSLPALARLRRLLHWRWALYQVWCAQRTS